MEVEDGRSSSNLGDSTGALASRRPRTVWTARQRDALLTAFARDPYPSFRVRQDLAREMGLPESRIRVWFQNRRNRTREVPRRGAQGAAAVAAGPSGLASPQRPREPGARARGGRSSPEEGRTRPRTRLSPAQLRILKQAFEVQPEPQYDARVKLAEETALPEDTVHIWFQNRRLRHPGGGRGRVRRRQGSLASQPPPPMQPPPPPPQPSPAPSGEPSGPPCSPRESEQHAQDGLLPPAAAALGLGVQTLSLPSPPPSSPVSSPAAAQPSESGPYHEGDPEPHPVANNYTVEDVELTLDQLLMQLQADQQAQDTLDPHVPWEDINPSLELPLDPQEYRTLLMDLL